MRRISPQKQDVFDPVKLKFKFEVFIIKSYTINYSKRIIHFPYRFHDKGGIILQPFKKSALLVLPFLIAFNPCWTLAEENPQAEDFRKTTWTELAQRYDNPYMSQDPDAQLTPDVLADWWKVFHDPELDHLIDLSLQNNRDLAMAQSRLMQARQQVGISNAARLPWINAGGGWIRARVPDSIKDDLRPDVSVSGLPVPVSVSTGFEDRNSASYAGLDASWELDVFGRIKNRTRAASNTVQARNGELYATWVSISAETAMNYITLRTLQSELAVTEQHIANQKENQELLRINYKNGLIQELPVKQSSYLLKSSEAGIPQLKKEISQTISRLSILTGTVPGALDAELMEPKPLPDVDPSLYNAIPAETLRQRPDVHAAERAWEAQINTTKSAKAELKPKFSILGILGLATLGTGGLFSAASRTFGIMPSVTYPLFNGGALRRNVKVQSEKEKEAQARYENVVLQAAAEVRTSMAAISQDKERTDSLEAGRDDAKEALDLSRTDYQNGLSDYMNVLDGERHYLELDQNYTVARGQELIDLVGLFKSMGGGWKPLDEKEAALASGKENAHQAEAPQKSSPVAAQKQK